MLWIERQTESRFDDKQCSAETNSATRGASMTLKKIGLINQNIFSNTERLCRAVYE